MLTSAPYPHSPLRFCSGNVRRTKPLHSFACLQKLRFCTQTLRFCKRSCAYKPVALHSFACKSKGYKSEAFVSVASQKQSFCAQIVDLQLRCCYATPLFASTASLANLRFAYKSVAFVSRWFVSKRLHRRPCTACLLCEAEQARVDFVS